MTQFPTVDRELYRTGTVEPINSAGMWPRLVDTDGRFLPTDGIRLAFWEELWPTQDDYNWQPYRSLPERDRKNDGRRLAFFVTYGHFCGERDKGKVNNDPLTNGIQSVAGH